MATPFTLSRDESTRVLLCCQEAAQGKHSRTFIDFHGKRLRVVVYPEPDVQAIYRERSSAQAGQ